MRILGLDLSLTATGIDDGTSDPTCFKPTTRGMPRLFDILDHVNQYARQADLVVIEGYSYGSHSSHAHELGELGGVIRFDLHQARIPYVDIPPALLKKFATGKGNAGKDQMVATAAREGCVADNNNAIDAWWLRQLAVYAYAGPNRLGGIDCIAAWSYRNETVAKVEWPQIAPRNP